MVGMLSNLVVHVTIRPIFSNSLDAFIQYYVSIYIVILLDFSLTVKAATFIFISGRGSAISSAKEGNSVFLYFGKELISSFGRANVREFHEKLNRIHTELTFINP